MRKLVRVVAEADRFETKILRPQEAQAGQDQAESYIRMRVGYRVEPVRISGLKEYRRMRLQAWDVALLDVVVSFPLVQHDDQVDTLNLTFSELAQHQHALEIWERLLE